MNIDTFIFLEKVRKIAFTFPAVTEASCFGTPGFYASKKLFARLREEGDVLVIYTEERDAWIKKDPLTFFVTDHYRNHPYMLVSLSRVKQKHLSSLIQTAWSRRVGKRLLNEWEASCPKNY